MSEIVSAAPQSGRANPQDGAGDRNVSSSEDIKIRTAACAPANDALLHGRVRRCRSCGCETTNDRVCDDCAAAWREERGAALGELLRVHHVQKIEHLPRDVMAAFWAEWGCA